MESSHEIRVKGFVQPKEFVEKWSSLYSYGNEDRYINHIDTVLDSKNSFIELFRWKNGTGGKISEGKRRTVERFWGKIDTLNSLRTEFNWDVYESEFQPQKTSNIWKLFLLHLIDPEQFPIYDQHVFRFYNFHKTGMIEEIPTNHSKRYEGYKEDYLNWFNEMKKKYNLNPKKMDESFFSYGQFLKGLNQKGLEVRSTE